MDKVSDCEAELPKLCSATWVFVVAHDSCAPQQADCVSGINNFNLFRQRVLMSVKNPFTIALSRRLRERAVSGGIFYSGDDIVWSTETPAWFNQQDNQLV